MISLTRERQHLQQRTHASGCGAHRDSRGFWFPSFTCTPRGADTQWPTTGAPEAFACQDWSDDDCARRGRGALRPTEGTPAAQFARFSGLWRKGKEPSTKLGWHEPRTTVWPPCDANHPGNCTDAHAPASTIKERTPPAEVCTTPVEIMKVHATCTCTTRMDRVIGPHTHCSVGRQVVDDQDHMRRGGAIGPHTHGNTARHVVDDLSVEGSG